jgi:hypothetical protein
VQAVRRSRAFIDWPARALVLATTVVSLLAASVFLGGVVENEPHGDIHGWGAALPGTVFFLVGSVATWLLARTAKRPRSGAAVLLASASPVLQTRVWFLPLVFAAVGAYLIAPQRPGNGLPDTSGTSTVVRGA